MIPTTLSLALCATYTLRHWTVSTPYMQSTTKDSLRSYNFNDKTSQLKRLYHITLKKWTVPTPYMRSTTEKNLQAWISFNDKTPQLETRLYHIPLKQWTITYIELSKFCFALHSLSKIMTLKRSDPVGTKITVVRSQPHIGVVEKDFHIDLFSLFQIKYASSKTGARLSGRQILVNHQENAIIGIKSHTILIVVWPIPEEHLHINIVTTTFGHSEFSILILKSAHHMAFGVIRVPCGNYWKPTRKQTTLICCRQTMIWYISQIFSLHFAWFLLGEQRDY